MATKLTYATKTDTNPVVNRAQQACAADFNEIKASVNDAIDDTTNHVGNTSNPHSVTKAQVGLTNVPNLDCTDPANIVQTASYRLVTDIEKSVWTGKQNNLGYTAEDSANKVSAWQVTPNNTKYPGEKLVKDNLDLKENLLPATPATPQKKHLNGNRVWADMPPVSGAYAFNLYFSNTASGIQPLYKQLKSTGDIAAVTKSIVVNNNTVNGEVYLFDTVLGVTKVNAGIWMTNFYCRVSAVTTSTQLEFRVFKRSSGGTDTQLFTVTSENIDSTSFINIRPYFVGAQYTIANTDRLGMSIHAKTTNVGNITVDYVIGGDNSTYVNMPIRDIGYFVNDITISNPVQYTYFSGDANTDGSWRSYVNGSNNMILETRINGFWTPQQSYSSGLNTMLNTIKFPTNTLTIEDVYALSSGIGSFQIVDKTDDLTYLPAMTNVSSVGDGKARGWIFNGAVQNNVVMQATNNVVTTNPVFSVIPTDTHILYQIDIDIASCVTGTMTVLIEENAMRAWEVTITNVPVSGAFSINLEPITGSNLNPPVFIANKVYTYTITGADLNGDANGVPYYKVNIQLLKYNELLHVESDLASYVVDQSYVTGTTNKAPTAAAIESRVLAAITQSQIGRRQLGTWNANTNNPTLVDPPVAPTYDEGDFYEVSTGGTQFGITWAIGDRAVVGVDTSNTRIWFKSSLQSDVFDSKNVYVTSNGSDSNSGTLSRPKLTLNGAYSVVAQPGQISVAVGGYTENITHNKQNITFIGSGVNGNNGVQLNGTITASAARFRAKEFQFAHGTSTGFTWNDTTGAHNFEQCSFVGTGTNPSFYASSTARGFANINDSDFSSTAAPANVVLTSLTAATATLYLNNCNGIRISIGTGWVVVITNCPNLMIVANTGTVVFTDSGLVNVNAILTSQGQLTALLSDTNVATDGYYICDFATPSIGSRYDILIKLSLQGIATLTALHRPYLQSPASISVYTVGGYEARTKVGGKWELVATVDGTAVNNKLMAYNNTLNQFYNSDVDFTGHEFNVQDRDLRTDRNIHFGGLHLNSFVDKPGFINNVSNCLGLPICQNVNLTASNWDIEKIIPVGLVVTNSPFQPIDTLVITNPDFYFQFAQKTMLKSIEFKFVTTHAEVHVDIYKSKTNLIGNFDWEFVKRYDLDNVTVGLNTLTTDNAVFEGSWYYRITFYGYGATVQMDGTNDTVQDLPRMHIDYREWAYDEVWSTTQIISGDANNGLVFGNDGKLFVTASGGTGTVPATKGGLISYDGVLVGELAASNTNDLVLTTDTSATYGIDYKIDPVQRKVTAKGDLLIGSANNVLSALALGTNGQTLVVDSTTTTGYAFKNNYYTADINASNGWTFSGSNPNDVAFFDISGATHGMGNYPIVQLYDRAQNPMWMVVAPTNVDFANGNVRVVVQYGRQFDVRVVIK